MTSPPKCSRPLELPRRSRAAALGLQVVAAWGILVVFLPWTGQAQVGNQGVRLSFPTGDLHLILMQYEELTGRKMILDNAVEGGKVLMDTTGYLSKEQAIQFIEKSLLLNGYAIVPGGDDPNLVKVIAFEAGKNPRSEGIRVVSHPLDLPLTDEVVTYVLPLSYLPPEDAVAALLQIAPGHPYGAITPLANAKALVITENSATIRSYLDLIDHIDVQPGMTEQRTFTLKRADAEEVATALKELLGLDDPDAAGGSARPAPVPAAGRPQPANPGQPAANTGLPAPVNGMGPVGGDGASPPPKVFAVTRTNRLLVIATPFDMTRIALLVEELDAPADSRRFLSIPLRYISVLGILEPLRNSLLSGSKDASGGDAGGLGAAGLGGGMGGALRPQLSGGGMNTGGVGSAFGSSVGGGGFGGGGGGFGGGGGGFGGGGGSLFGGGGGGAANQAPVSIIVGKTLIIADPISNELFVSGPPDHLETMAELVAQLDRKPRQVMIETVIGQLTLGDEFDFGIDWLHTLEGFRSGTGDGAGAGTARFRGRNSSSAIPDIAGLTDFANLAGASASGVTLYGLIGTHLNVYLSALETSNRFKVLSKPTVFTMNNVPAAISSGQRIAVPSSTLTAVGPGVGANPSVSATIQYETVVLEIEVVPLINSEDELTLQIRQKNDDVAGSTNIGGNDVPNITTQQLSTTVVVPNRSSVLLGGLITERETDGRSGLPILSRVPVVRHAMGSTRNRVDRSELLIFIQPTIVEEPYLAQPISDEISRESALAPAIPAFPAMAGPEAREFASPGGRIPMWKKMFGRTAAPALSSSTAP